MTATVTEEEAFWLYIGELPDCRDRRGQVADWYEDRAGLVEIVAASAERGKVCGCQQPQRR